MAYKKGTLDIGNVDYEDYSHIRGNFIYLPHRCDEWVIGGVEDAQALIQDLEEAIEKLKTK